MNRDLLAAVVSGALALPMAAQVQADEADVQPHSHPATYQHDHEMDDGSMSPLHAHQHDAHPHAQLHGHSATLYGNLRYGVKMTDTDAPGSDAEWNLSEDMFSRWGVKGSMDAGNGVTAGFKFERNLGGGMSARYHHVSLSGTFGTATFGQQDSPYRGATSWDGTQAFGGAGNGTAARTAGVSFASNLGGPFSFSALVGSGAKGGNTSGEGADHFEVSGKLAVGPANLSLGYLDSNDGMRDVTRIGGTVDGNLAAINWEVGYNVGTDTCGTDCDDERFGFHLGYGVVEGGNVYMNYSDNDFDDMANEKDANDWVFGYSHVVAKNVVVYAEYGMHDENDVETTEGVVALKVGF